jgi:peptidoglycan L-alanyl-D-glutamate endopeptidase CwlK
MAADLEILIPEFRAMVKELIKACDARGAKLRPSASRRDPLEQARLWRQSRTIEQITKKITSLRQQKADFLADCIERVGPQHGDPVTNAIPGLSWHQWDEALDCFWVVNGAAEWSTSKLVNGLNGYHVYAEEAHRLGLNAGGTWHSFQDWPHVQFRSAGSPDDVMSLMEISNEMKKRFG